MPTIVATVGSETANSYVTTAEMDTYTDGRLDAGEWSDAADTSPETQTPALIMAARRIDQELFRGRKYDTDQALEWPRTGVTDRNGYAVGTDEIPVGVKRAQMELALALLKDNELLDDHGLEGLESVRIGPLSVDAVPHSAGALPAAVRRELAPFLVSTGGIRLERA